MNHDHKEHRRVRCSSIRISLIAATAIAATAAFGTSGYAFSVNDRVIVTSNNGVNVRSTPGGTNVGGQVKGATGTITNGPVTAQVGGTGTYYTWWDVDFDNSSVDGWVVQDGITVQGAETVSAPGIAGSNSGNAGTSYTYTAGGASSSLGHSIQYLFDWGDGNTSGWLAVGVTSASHAWSSSGTYAVRAQARCATHTSVVSSYSGILSVNIAPSTAPSIASVSPNPVPGSNSTQPFTITGSNFTTGCIVNLRDVTSSLPYPNRHITALTSSQISLNPVFGIEAHDWTVEVVNGNTSSGPFPFKVTAGSSPAISVTTVTTTNFGAVRIGSSRDLAFTVANVGSGTLSGSASVSSPFSVAQGASYALATGQQQTVTVRYSPTAVQSDSASVAFTGGGGATRQVTGSGITDAASGFGGISGRVTDTSGNAVGGARVVARGQSDYSKTSPSSSESGIYALSGLLPAANYLVQVFTDGQKFYLKEITNVNVTAGQITQLNIQLQPVPAVPPPTFGANEIPVVLVRGVGENVDWYHEGYWSSIRAALAGDPLNPPPVRAVWDCNEPEANVSNGQVINGELTIEANARTLLPYINSKANQFKKRWGVYPPYIDMITHSMGGLIVRRALGKEDYFSVTDSDTNEVSQLPVRRVVMLAPPNAGTVLSDKASEFPYLLYYRSRWLSTKDLQTQNIRYNFDSNPWPAKVQLYLLAATGGSVSPDAQLRFSSGIMKSNSNNLAAEEVVDGAVSRPSVPGTWYEPSTSLTGVYSLAHGIFNPVPVLNQTDVDIGGGYLDHFSILNSTPVITWLESILTGSAQSLSMRPWGQASTSSQSATPAVAAGPGLQQLELTTGSVNSGAISEVSVQCDSATQLRINVAMSDTAATIRLRDPAGVIIDASGSSSVEYTSIPGPDSQSVTVQFAITNPATGAWTVIVDASSVSAKSLQYQLSAYDDSSVALIPRAAPLFNQGREALLACTVADLSSQPARGMSGAQVTADVTLPDSTAANLILLDDGLHGDGASSDGTYAAGLSDTTQSGTYRVIYRARGTDSQGRIFQRAADTQFSVSTNAGSLGGELSHTFLDVDSNGTLDVVRLQSLVIVNIPGSYVLSGELVNANGTLRIATSANLDNMDVGTTTASLLFNLPQDTSSLGELHLENLELFKQQDDGNSWVDTYSLPYNVILPTPTLVSVVSRKTHGTGNNPPDFDIILPLTGTRGVECRTGPTAGSHTIVLGFENPLTSAGSPSATVTTSSGTTSLNPAPTGAIGTDPHQYIVNLTGVPNACYLTVTLDNVVDSVGSSGNVTGPQMGVLLGDVNGNGTVTNADVTLVKAQVSSPVSGSNFRNDVNANGVLSNGDVSLTKSQVSAALPTPP